MFNNTKGTLVGYFVPDVFKQMVLSRFHFHYIEEPRDKGGHVFDFSFNEATVSIQSCCELRVILPNMIEFDKMDLNQDIEHALQVAEKKRSLIKNFLNIIFSNLREMASGYTKSSSTK